MKRGGVHRPSAPALASGAQQSQDGQATIEYILILAVAVGLFMAFVRASGRLQIEQKIMRPLTEDFAHAYRLGHPQARARDEEGGPNLIARDRDKVRLFLNPKPE
jgi:hypothetical protein